MIDNRLVKAGGSSNLLYVLETISENTTWICPENIASKVCVRLFGGGGGGGCGNFRYTNGPLNGGGGGGGGHMAYGEIDLAGGTSVNKIGRAHV